MTQDTVQDYWESVESIARETRDEYPDRDDDERNTYVHESVDGSSWIIYYHANEIVLEATSNEPDGAEVRGMSADDADWRQMRATAAFMAMELDVYDELTRLDDEADEAELDALLEEDDDSEEDGLSDS